MLSTVKVQQTKTNTIINLPKDIRKAFAVEKGDIVIIETISENEIKIKKV